MGHDVTLFATGDSTTSATLVPVRAQAARFVPNFERNNAPYARMLELVRRRAREFDVLHFHIDFHPFSLFSRQPHPVRQHAARPDGPGLGPDIYDLFPEVKLVSVSDSQRRPMPHLDWAATVLHGMPPDLLTPLPAERARLLRLPRPHLAGEGHRERHPHRRRCGVKLQDRRQDRRGGCAVLSRCASRRCCAAGDVEFLGEIDDAHKPAFLSGARALLFPIDWPEPFGLVMIEAMACGCPGHRLPPRQRARGGGGRRHRLRRRQRGRGGGGLRPRWTRSTAPPYAAASSSAGPRGRMADDYRLTLSTDSACTQRADAPRCDRAAFSPSCPRN